MATENCVQCKHKQRRRHQRVKQQRDCPRGVLVVVVVGCCFFDSGQWTVRNHENVICHLEKLLFLIFRWREEVPRQRRRTCSWLSLSAAEESNVEQSRCHQSLGNRCTCHQAIWHSTTSWKGGDLSHTICLLWHIISISYIIIMSHNLFSNLSFISYTSFFFLLLFLLRNK